MTALERQMATDAVALSKEHADRADVAEARLEALKEALLRLAEDWDIKAKTIGGRVSLEDCDGATAGFKMIGYQNHRDHAAALREAITTALTGQEPQHGG